MIVKISTAIIIRNLCIVCILIEKIAYTLCVCVLVCSSGIIFGKVCIYPVSGTVLLVVSVQPLVPGCTVK